MTVGSPHLQRPIPQRPFETHASKVPSPEHSASASPQPSLLDTGSDGRNEMNMTGLGRTRSVMNLTSSTLYGIYSPTGYSNEREEPSTPWGTGAETPKDIIDEGTLRDPIERPLRRRQSSHSAKTHLSWPNYLVNLGFRALLLFCIGMGYGLLVTQLHDEQQLAPFQVRGIIKPGYNCAYLIFWGIAGIGLGSLLPWVDALCYDTTTLSVSALDDHAVTGEKDEVVLVNNRLSQDWNPAVRSIGAFVGIAFAIVSHLSSSPVMLVITFPPQRKLPWSSTLQVSLTLALVNPVLWYLIDRSKPGFLLSVGVGLIGTGALLSLNPDMMPSPAVAPPMSTRINNATRTQSPEIYGGLISQETIECGIWIISVLFCSCVCFGNIGRRLALKRNRIVEKTGGTW